VDFAQLADALARNESPSICNVRELDEGWYAEPLSAWRRLSAHAHLIIHAGSRARRGELPFETREQLLADMFGLPKNTPPEMIQVEFQRRLWETERKWASPSMQWTRAAVDLGITRELPKTIADAMVGRVRDVVGTEKHFARTLQQPDALAEKVNQWIEDGGGFQQKAVWHDERADWQRRVRSLFAAIGVGLWNVIGDMTTNPECPSCGQVFTPGRRTQRYCEDCGIRGRNRVNQRRSRARKATRGVPAMTAM
jgi:hypothetical protein